MLKDIDVMLCTDYYDPDIRPGLDEMADKVICSGMIDAYYGYCFGKLEYRSIAFEEKRIDIKIEELVYNFADFDWYYSKMGKDAGILYLFEDALKEYNKYLIENNLSDINVISDISVSDKKNMSMIVL